MAELGNRLFQWVLISFCVFSFVWILCLKYLRSFRLLVSEKLNENNEKPVISKYVPTTTPTKVPKVYILCKAFSL